MSERKPLTLEELREVPHGKIKDETLRHICDRANDIASKPIRLDRSAWEPCKSCESKCRTCLRNETSRCKKCNNYDCYYPVSNFCQHCGRPLTDAAWEMLERRLARHEHQ